MSLMCTLAIALAARSPAVWRPGAGRSPTCGHGDPVRAT